MPNLYFLALLPPEDLTRQIHKIRLECAEKFGVKRALKPPVHITLYRPFWMEGEYEQHLSKLLHQGTNGISPFNQQLENFGSFGIQVVYIHALKSWELTRLRKAILSVFRVNQIDSGNNEKNTAFNPHITIAYRDVAPEVFPKIWEEYKNKKLKRSFKVDHFTLSKHDKVRWNPIENIPIISTNQTSLF